MIDGHNRYEICTANKIDYKTTEKEFKSRDEVIAWIVDTQLSRRNLTEQQRKFFRGKEYKIEKKAVGAQEGNKSAEKQRDKNLPFVSEKKTAEKLAEKHQVSQQTIKNDEKFHDGVEKIGSVSPEAAIYAGFRKYGIA